MLMPFFYCARLRFSILISLLLAPIQLAGTDEFKLVDPPPIKRIVMFNSGLAQFFHEGEVDGDCRVEMKFTDADIDNVLKSLVFEDKSDGVVRSVEFKPAPGKTDVAAQKIGPPLTMAQTLQKYRGEQVVIETAKQKYDGNTWSVENRQQGQDVFETVTIFNDDGFSSIPLSEIRSLQFANPKLNREFKLAMTGIAESRTADLKNIELQFTGKGKRIVKYSYNVDSPIWRMTYRLNISDQAANIQGWAHIDNVTGVDWEDIDLDLRSGRPQSFHVDLFRPVLAIRPDIGLGVFGLPIDRILHPSFLQGLGSGKRAISRNVGGFGGGGGGGFGIGGGGFGGGGGGPEDDGDSMVINSAFDSVPVPSRPAQMVQFNIEKPVNLKAGRSSMIPVMSEKVNARWQSQIILDSGKGAQLVALLKNELDYPLIPGPMTLFKNGELIGDSVLKRIEPGKAADLVFGKDRSVYLEDSESKTVTKVKYVNWTGDKVVVRFDSIHTRKFKVVNKDSLPRDLRVTLEKLGGKIDPQPAETNDSGMHYEMQCGAGKSVSKTVKQTNESDKKWSVSSITREHIAQWRKDGAEIESGLVERLEKIFKLSDQLDERYELTRKTQKLLDNIISEQRRISDILKALGETSETQQQFLNQLSSNETKLRETREKIGQLDSEAARLNEELKTLYKNQ